MDVDTRLRGVERPPVVYCVARIFLCTSSLQQNLISDEKKKNRIDWISVRSENNNHKASEQKYNNR